MQFGPRRAFCLVGHETGITNLLRITVDERIETKWLRVEGRVIGIWAQEFERSWREVAAGLDSRPFGVDLRGVTHMDAHGRRVLAEIHHRTGAEFLADSPLTKFYAEEARRGGAAKGDQEERDEGTIRI